MATVERYEMLDRIEAAPRHKPRHKRHYAEAERLLGLAESASEDERAELLAQAQVHATLALSPSDRRRVEIREV